MHKIIQQLTDDHRRFLTIQDIFRAQMEVFPKGGDERDIPLLLDIMDYLVGYSETFHHSLEDQIYEKIRMTISNPQLSHMLDSIEMQHAQMGVLSKRLLNSFTAIANNQVIPTERIVYDFNAYLDLSEEHIKCENSYLLPIILKIFADEELDNIHQISISSIPNYLQKFDAYASLFEQIQSENLAMEV